MAAPLFSSIKASDLFSKFKPESRFWKILNFPLLRIIVIALFLVPIMALNAVVVFSIIEQVEEPLATHIDIVRMIITIPLLLMSYGLYCRFFEKRKAFEISLKGAWKEWLVGALVAASLVTLFVALISVFGSFEILDPALRSVPPGGRTCRNLGGDCCQPAGLWVRAYHESQSDDWHGNFPCTLQYSPDRAIHSHQTNLGKLGIPCRLEFYASGRVRDAKFRNPVPRVDDHKSRRTSLADGRSSRHRRILAGVQR